MVLTIGNGWDGEEKGWVHREQQKRRAVNLTSEQKTQVPNLQENAEMSDVGDGKGNWDEMRQAACGWHQCRQGRARREIRVLGRARASGCNQVSLTSKNPTKNRRPPSGKTGRRLSSGEGSVRRVSATCCRSKVQRVLGEKKKDKDLGAERMDESSPSTRWEDVNACETKARKGG